LNELYANENTAYENTVTEHTQLRHGRDRGRIVCPQDSGIHTCTCACMPTQVSFVFITSSSAVLRKKTVVNQYMSMQWNRLMTITNNWSHLLMS